MSVMIHPFVLSGGSGTRLWPLSRRALPKQLLPLVGDESLLQQSCRRLADPLFAEPTILCNDEHRFLVADQLQDAGRLTAQVVLEPIGRNTAPAAIVAALRVFERVGGDGLVLLMPSDHVMQNPAGFRHSVEVGAESAAAGHIVTFGVRPTGPETGYGYIETADRGGSAHEVLRFVEKPSREVAEGYLAAGTFFWNAGIFLYSAATMIAAFETHAPEILAHCRAALAGARTDLDFVRLDGDAYGRCDDISLDYAIMEKASGIRCVPLETPWSDLGSWSALWEVGDKDASGNVVLGDVLLRDTADSYVDCRDGACIALIGMRDVVAVATKDAVLVAPKDRAQEVGRIVDTLKESGRGEHIYHTRVHRPWGWYEGLILGERFQVKCLQVKPGARLSLQSHHHRAEHWVVVSGTAEVTVGDRTFTLTENESTYIPIGERHRLANPGRIPTLLVEVQSGTYLGEDDIVRYEDDFNRDR